MAKAIHALDFLSAGQQAEIPPVCVAFGEEPFLRQLVKARLRR